MEMKRLARAVVAGSALLAASGAYARDDHRRGYGPQAHFDDRHHGHRHFRHAPRFVYRQAPPPYYYAPEPVYYPPQPVYYAPPRPVIYGSLPLGDTRLRIGVQF